MLQIVLDHLISHLPDGSAKISSCPKMPTPVALFQMWKLFEQVARCPSFDSPHDFTGGQIWRSTHQNMDMVFTHHSFDNPYFKGFTRLSDQVSDSFRHLATQHSTLCNDISLPKQNGIQFGKPYGSRIYSPSPPPWPNYRS